MDETAPLLVTPDREVVDVEDRLRDAGGARKEDIVDFDPAGDPENPMEWPAPYKWSIVALLALTAFTVYVHLTLPYLTYPPTLGHFWLPLDRSISSSP